MLYSKGELLITIMSSLAQEESRSISENLTWGKRKRFADGKVSLAYSSFLGYRKGEDGQMEIVPQEADTVRLIYRMFMQGQTPYAIAKYLTDKGIPTPTGKETWRHRTVENILSNENYKGDARLQKCYTVDFLFKKRKADDMAVQRQVQRRKQMRHAPSVRAADQGAVPGGTRHPDGKPGGGHRGLQGGHGGSGRQQRH